MALNKIKMNSREDAAPNTSSGPSQGETPAVAPAAEPAPSNEIDDKANLLKMRMRKMAGASLPPVAAATPSDATGAGPDSSIPKESIPAASPAGTDHAGKEVDVSVRTTHLVRESANGKLTPTSGPKLSLKKEPAAAAPPAAPKSPVIPGIPAPAPVPVAPPPATAETAPPQKTVSKSVSKPADGGGLVVKKTKLEMPADIAIPPPSMGKKPKKATGPSSSSAGAAIALVLGANAMLSIIPLLKVFLNTGVFPSNQMIISIVFPLVLIMMIGSMKKQLLLMAGILMGVNALAAIALIVARPAIGQLPVPGLSAMMPTTHMAAGAFLLLIGGILLLTGFGVAQWVAALILAASGCAIPWVPLENFLPPEWFVTPKSAVVETPVVADDAEAVAAVATNTSATKDFTIKLPDNWKMVSAPGAAPAAGMTAAAKPSYTFSLMDGSLTLLVTPETVAESVTLADYTAAKLAAFKGESPGANGMIMDVPGCSERKRLFIILGDDAVEMLIVAKKNQMYVLFSRGNREMVQSHRPELDKIFKSFLLN